jgi:hypothetical protein
MWTTFYMCVYIPLTWMSFGLDYKLWGLNPAGFHFTSLVLHAASAGLLFSILFRLLGESQAAIARRDHSSLILAAWVGALFWAVHPLRVESVVWVTERRDVLSGFFLLVTLLLYLHSENDARLRRISYGTYLASLFAKASGITLPALLVVVDAYRYVVLPADKRDPALWRQWLQQKIPYLLICLPIAALAFYGQTQTGSLAPIEVIGGPARLALMSHSMLFYLAKSLWPCGLSPLYPLPSLPTMTSGLYLGFIFIFLLITALLWSMRRRYPGVLTAWAWYLIALLPFSGILHNGRQATADRYSYLPSLSLAALAAGGAYYLFEKAVRSRRHSGVSLAACALLIGALMAQTRRQTRFWHDSITLWSRVIEIEPDAVTGHNNLGAALAENGDLMAALAHFQEALRLDPGHPGAQRNLKKALDLLKKPAPGTAR